MPPWSRPMRRSSKRSSDDPPGNSWRANSTSPRAKATWRNGPVSSSRTGAVPNRRPYHGALTDRSLTVTATWVTDGNSAIMSPLYAARPGSKPGLVHDGNRRLLDAPKSGRRRALEGAGISAGGGRQPRSLSAIMTLGMAGGALGGEEQATSDTYPHEAGRGPGDAPVRTRDRHRSRGGADHPRRRRGP